MLSQWYPYQQFYCNKSDAANSDVDEDNDPDFEEDDGFRYFGDDDEPTMR